MTEFVIDGKGKKLSVAVRDKIPRIGYDTLRKLLRKGEIRVNGKKVFSDVFLYPGDTVRVYYKPEETIKVIYDDDNIAVLLKPTRIASVGEGSFDELVRAKFPNYIISHRLDTNTDGLVIFAKNNAVFDGLKDAFKNHKIEKKYLCVVYGVVDMPRDLKAYLSKDAESGEVRISDNYVQGYEEILTKIAPIESSEGITLLDVNLITGKTHQIRAHLAHENLPIIGDPKYGRNEINRHYGKRYQMLHAYKLVFHIDTGILSYLNGKEIEVDTDEYNKEFDRLLLR